MLLYLVSDETGSFPMLWDQAGPPKDSPTLTWRRLAEVGTIAEALAVIEALGLRPAEPSPSQTGLPAGESAASGALPKTAAGPVAKIAPGPVPKTAPDARPASLAG